MKNLVCGLVAATLVLAACGEEADGPSPESGEPLSLPAEFLGEWEFVGTSGGIDGGGLPDEGGPRPRIVLTADNTLERRAPDGAVAIRRFRVKKGKTIFASEDLWMIVTDPGSIELVVQLAPDGSMSMSENVYDGYSSGYRRVEE